MNSLRPDAPMVIPQVRIQVDQLKQSMIHYLHVNHEELYRLMGEEIEKTVTQDEIKRIVAEEAAHCVRDEVQNFFHYGSGKDVIRQAVDGVLEETLKILFPLAGAKNTP